MVGGIIIKGLGVIGIAVLLLCCSQIYQVQGQIFTNNGEDDCLNTSVSLIVVRKTIQVLNPSNNSNLVINLQTDGDRNNLMKSMYQVLLDVHSPWALGVGMGFLSNTIYGIQTCGIYSSICAYVEGDPFYGFVVDNSKFGDYYVRFYRVGDRNGNFTFDVNNFFLNTGSTYLVTSRDWFNVSNDWSVPYQFYQTTGVQSRTYVGQISNVRVFADRYPEEPCASCLARSSCPALSNFVVNSAPLVTFQSVNTTAGIQSVFNFVLLSYLVPWQIQYTISSIGFGFDNDDFYQVTDCYASPINTSIPECNGGKTHYFGEVINVAVFGDSKLRAYSFNTGSGGIDTSSPSVARVEAAQFQFITTQTPWYKRKEGWTDQYALPGSTYYGRSYARFFNGGVVVASANPNLICPVPDSKQLSTSSTDYGRHSFVIRALSLLSSLF